ncbi:hypothetical protein GCM10029992_53810 [Glycomyces albus]
MRQADQYEPDYLLGRRAEKLEYADSSPVLEFDDGTRVACGSVLITGGIGSFTSRPLPAADAFEGDGVVYFVPELAAHAGHHVVVVGGGDSAFDWALALHPWRPRSPSCTAVRSSAPTPAASTASAGSGCRSSSTRR